MRPVIKSRRRSQRVLNKTCDDLPRLRSNTRHAEIIKDGNRLRKVCLKHRKNACNKSADHKGSKDGVDIPAKSKLQPKRGLDIGQSNDHKAKKKRLSIDSDVKGSADNTAPNDVNETFVAAMKGGNVSQVLDTLRSNKTAKLITQENLDYVLEQAVLKKDLFMVKQLTFYGARVCDFGRNCLHTASMMGYVDIVEELINSETRKRRKYYIEHIACVPDDEGNTALHLCQLNPAACQITRLILKLNEVDINFQNNNGETAIMKAIENKNINSLIQLVNAGADMEIKDHLSNTVLSIASSLGLQHLIEFLVDDNSGDHSHLIRAVKKRDIDIVQVLLSSGCFQVDDEHDENGDTALTVLFNSNWKLKRHAPRKGRKGKRLFTRDSIDWIDHIIINEEEDYEENEFYDKVTLQPFSNIEMKIMTMLLDYGACVYTPGKFGTWNNPLHISCQMENLKLLKYLINSIRARRPHSNEAYAKALEIAIDHGRCDMIEVIEILLNCLYSEKMYYEPCFRKSICLALASGKKDVVSVLINGLLFHDFDYAHAVIVACNAGHYDIYMMLRNKWSEDFENMVSLHDGVVWLSHACRGKSVDIVRDLIQSGASATGVARDTLLPLKEHILLATCNPPPLNILKLLLKNGASLTDVYATRMSEFSENSLGRDEYTHAFSIGDKLIKNAIQANDLECIKYLMEIGCELKFQVLFSVANGFFKSEEKMRKLVASYMPKVNFDLNQLDEKGVSLLSAATQCNFVEFVDILVRKCPNVNLNLTPSGCPTALSLAVKNKNEKIVRLLLDHGADVNTFNSKHSGPLAMAAVHDDDTATFTSLLISKGADLNTLNENGRTALMVASKADNLASFKMLIDSGADINIERRHPRKIKGNTVLSSLLKKGVVVKFHYIEYLIKKSCLGVKISATKNVFALVDCHVHIPLYLDLMHCGAFSPILMTLGSDTGRFKGLLSSAMGEVLSPLCIALLLNKVKLAHHLWNTFYLTFSDYVSLPQHDLTKRLLEHEGYTKGITFLKEMAKNPPSLFRLSLAKMSDLIGPGPGRKERVEELGLPQPLPQTLLFISAGQLIQKKNYKDHLFSAGLIHHDGTSDDEEDDDVDDSDDDDNI